MQDTKKLLAVIELGGYPDFSPLYRDAGYEVIIASSMRKALSLLKAESPDIVVAEFIYGPMYSARISNLESLMAGMQRHTPNARLIVFHDKENTEHLDSLRTRFEIFENLSFPVDQRRLTKALQRAAE